MRRLVASERLHACAHALRNTTAPGPVVFEVSHPLASAVSDLSVLGLGIDPLVQPQMQSCSEIELPLDPMAGGRASCAFLWFSLDRSLHPRLLLNTLRQRMLPGGRLFVKVQNALSVKSLLAGNQWRGLEQFSQRRYYFTTQTLRRLLESAGFAIDRVQTGCDLELPESRRLAAPDNGPWLVGELRKYLKCLFGYPLGILESFFTCGEVITVEASAV